jgi:hypothetical protein
MSLRNNFGASYKQVVRVIVLRLVSASLKD